MNECPIALCEIIESRNHPGKYLLRIAVCPICGKAHFHGLGDNHRKPLLGFRVAHCDYSKPRPIGTYELKLKSRKIIKKPKTKRR